METIHPSFLLPFLPGKSWFCDRLFSVEVGVIGAKGATLNDWETTCGTFIDFTIFLHPSFVVRGLWGRVVVHESTAHHRALRGLPGQSAGRRTDQYDLPQEHPSFSRGLFSPPPCRHQWALQACRGQRANGSLRSLPRRPLKSRQQWLNEITCIDCDSGLAALLARRQTV